MLWLGFYQYENMMSIIVIAMYSVYVLKIDPPTTFKIFPKIDLLMTCSLCPQSLSHENISF